MKTNLIFQLLRIKNFQKLWGSQILSQVTLNMINFLIILHIFQATHSTVAVSLVWLFYALPVIFIGPFSGTITDLVDKRNVLRLTTLCESIIVLGYLFAKTKIWPVYTVIFLYSSASQLYIPAEASTLPAVVPRKLLPVANSFFLFTIYGSFLLGFGLAGPLVRIAGKELPFLFCSIFLATASFLVSRLPPEQQSRKKEVQDLQDFWNRAKEGYGFIKNEPMVLFPLILLVLSQVIAGIAAVLSPSFATEVLGIDVLDIGLVLAPPVVLGAVVGAQGVIRAIQAKIRKKKIISFGLFLGGIIFSALALLLPYLGSIRTQAAIVMSFLLGISFVSVILPVQTIIQETTPEEFRGRVFGILGFAITLASILPVLFTATVADLFGVNFIMAILGFSILAFAIYSLRESHEIFRYNRT